MAPSACAQEVKFLSMLFEETKKIKTLLLYMSMIKVQFSERRKGKLVFVQNTLIFVIIF